MKPYMIQCDKKCGEFISCLRKLKSLLTTATYYTSRIEIKCFIQKSHLDFSITYKNSYHDNTAPILHDLCTQLYFCDNDNNNDGKKNV